MLHFSVCIIFLYYIFFNLKRRRWSDFLVKLNVLYLGPVTYSYIGNWSDPVRDFTDGSWFYFRKMYRLDPDKNRACTRRTVSVRRFFWAPKANVKTIDKIFTIFCWIFSLSSRPRNRMEILGILARVWTYNSIPREDSDQVCHQHYWYG